MPTKIEFDTLEVFSDDGEVQVELEWIGEGKEGDYDLDDQEDVPLLRYSVFRRFHITQDENKISELCECDAYNEGEWMCVKDSSYCTQLPATAPREQLVDAAKFILELVESNVRDFKREKRLYERISWMRLNNGKPVC